MTRHKTSLPTAYFDDLYARDPDPWRFASSPYEREKYAATLAALPKKHYVSALEIGCSIGVLTRQLAACADTVCAVDVAAKALDVARRHCADLDQVRFDLIRVPEEWPCGRFDLIVLSEVVYYLDPTDVKHLSARLRDSAASDCDIILVHWTGVTNYPLTGDEAAEELIAMMSSSFAVLQKAQTEAYRLDILQKAAQAVHR